MDGTNNFFANEVLVHNCVVDDPFANVADANSPTIRQNIWDWFTTVVDTRLEGASTLCVHTRWHRDDLIGRLVEDQGWDYVNLTALAEPDDPLGRAPGEALWPERFPVEELQRKKGMDEFAFAALYQGRPRPRGATVFVAEPRYYDRKKTDLKGCRVVLGCDPAASEKTSADFSAAVVLAVRGRADKAEYYVLEVMRRQVQVPQLVRDLRAMQARNWNPAISVESVAGFKAVPQMLRDVDATLRINEIQPVGDKFQRAQGFATAWNEGRVFLPQEMLPDGRYVEIPWIAAYIRELMDFTGVKDAQDDQVDASSHAFLAANSEVLVHRGAVEASDRWTRR